MISKGCQNKNSNTYENNQEKDKNNIIIIIADILNHITHSFSRNNY